MWKLAFAQIKHHPGRYVATVLAIVIGTVFFAGALLVNSSGTATVRKTIGIDYSNADVVAVLGYATYEGDDERLAAAATDPNSALNQLPEVAEAYAPFYTTGGLQRSETGLAAAEEDPDLAPTWFEDFDEVTFKATPRHSDLLPYPILEGEPPAPGKYEVLLPASLAELNDFSIGDEVTIDTGFEVPEPVSISGIFDDSEAPYLIQWTRSAWISDTLVELYHEQQAADRAELAQEDGFEYLAGEGTYRPWTFDVLIRLEPGVSVGPTVIEHITEALLEDGLSPTSPEDAQQSFTVATPEDYAVSEFENGTGVNIFTVFLVAFALLALFVTGLVISNTFTVLVAQRTRQYALQRVLGATRGQVQGSVLVESLLLGLIASTLGVLIAMGLTWAVITILREFVDGFEIISFGADWSLLWVILIGTLVTVVAASGPAVRATRVSPLAAMNPVPPAAPGETRFTSRIVLGAIVFLAGTALMFYGVVRAGIFAAVVGGAISFIGVLMLAVLLVPSAVYGVGFIPRKLGGVPGKMAQLNSVRNRRRTAATGSALLIGTTLVALMITGGRTLEMAVTASWDTRHAADIYAQGGVDNMSEVAANTGRLANTPGVEHVLPLFSTGEVFWDPEQVEYSPEELEEFDMEISDLVAHIPLAVITPEQAEVTALDDATIEALDTVGTVVLPQWFSDPYGYERPDLETLKVFDTGGDVQELDVYYSNVLDGPPLLSPETADTLGGIELDQPGQLWVMVSEQASEDTEMLSEIAAQVDTLVQPRAYAMSPILDLLVFEQIINMMLAIVVGLLAVSVIIALVGVANTLSLSTLERARENSLMRALGLTKRGLKAMLAWEAVLIAGVSALLGCIFGVFYGWAGAQSAMTMNAGVVDEALPLSEIEWIAPAIPWVELLIILAIAIIAGLLAAILPARRAVKTPPVAGLAAE